MEFNWLLAIGLFAAATVVDAIFALYTVAVMKTQPFKAASLSFLTYIVEAVSVVSYIENRLYLVPLAFGAFAGSYTVVKWEAIKANKKQGVDRSTNSKDKKDKQDFSPTDAV